MSDTVWNTLDADLEEFRRRLRVRVRKALRDITGEGVGSPAFHILDALARRGPFSPSDLASALEVRTSTMTSHIDRLEDLGWVAREPAQAGTNRVRVQITPVGREAVQRYVAARRAVLHDVLAPLPPHLLAALGEALHLVVEPTTNPAEAMPEAD